MRAAVVGAGAIGAYVGAALARGGTEVHLVARGEHLDARQLERVPLLRPTELVNEIARHGLLLVNAGANTLRLIPPLVITREEIDLLIERLTTLFTTLDS